MTEADQIAESSGYPMYPGDEIAVGSLRGRIAQLEEALRRLELAAIAANASFECKCSEELRAAIRHSYEVRLGEKL